MSNQKLWQHLSSSSFLKTLALGFTKEKELIALLSDFLRQLFSRTQRAVASPFDHQWCSQYPSHESLSSWPILGTTSFLFWIFPRGLWWAPAVIKLEQKLTAWVISSCIQHVIRSHGKLENDIIMNAFYIDSWFYLGPRHD